MQRSILIFPRLMWTGRSLILTGLISFLPSAEHFFLKTAIYFRIWEYGICGQSFCVSRRIGLTEDGQNCSHYRGIKAHWQPESGFAHWIHEYSNLQKYDQPPQNYTVAAFDQKIFKRSNIRGMFTNRQDRYQERIRSRSMMIIIVWPGQSLIFSPIIKI